MSQAETRTQNDAALSETGRPPSVLVVLVSRDGMPWLKRCLTALSRQTHPRIGILAVDNASTDGSDRLLSSSLGADRVIRLAENRGFPAAVDEALRSNAGRLADYVLLLHDDTLLAPEAVARLVEAAERMEGVGIVGPKVLDAEEPNVLAEIGQSADRFGYPYSPLEKGEIDQGQYDRVREVLYVSSCAMLVARRVLDRIGPPDERFTSQQEDLDLCWRARVAGFRVLWTPQAVALHRGATVRGERTGTKVPVGIRYAQERAAVNSMLKNYGVLTLLWILPLSIAQSAVRIVYYAITRRFDDAIQMVAAWGWNIAHLAGTIRRRVRTQSVRAVPDRQIRQFMAPAWFRLSRSARQVVDAVRPLRDEPLDLAGGDDDEGPMEHPSIVGRIGRFAVGHPVAVAWILATFLAAFAYRHLSGDSPLAGGALTSFPSSASGFFGELYSGVRHTGLGGSAPGSPALGMLGLGSVLAFGAPALLQKAMIMILPAAAAVGVYRTVRSLNVDKLASVIAASCYGLSAVVLWGVSQGRIPELVFLAGLPWLCSKLTQAFAPMDGSRRLRWVVGAGLGLAALASFFPGTLLAALVLMAVAFLFPVGESRFRGSQQVALALAVALVLALPVALSIVGSNGRGLADVVGTRSFFEVLRLSLGPDPGGWRVAFYLPLAALLSLVFVTGEHRGPAIRAFVAGAGSVYLAWAASAGWLPPVLSNPVAYVGVAAVSFSVLVGLGFQSMVAGVARASFGYRQLGSGLLVILVAGGLLGQAFQASRGAWAIGGPDRLPAAYPVVGRAGPPPYRVLWIGRLGGSSLPPPAGPVDGVVDAGTASVRFALTAPSGGSALDIGRPDFGPGYDRLREIMGQILSGTTRHGGALLAPFGIRFIVATPTDLPYDAALRLGQQVDLDPVIAGGLIIFTDPSVAPLASVIADPTWAHAAATGGLQDSAELPPPTAQPLLGSPPVYHGPPADRAPLVFLSQQVGADWTLTPKGVGDVPKAAEAFDWAIRFTNVTAPAGFEVRATGQQLRTILMTLLLLLWLAALWVTRRPAEGS